MAKCHRVAIVERRREVRARLYCCWQRDQDWVRAPTASMRNERRAQGRVQKTTVFRWWTEVEMCGWRSL